MKNRHFEGRRRLARQYHRNRRGDQFEHGILTRHEFDAGDATRLSWWDDFEFILGGVRVVVSWQHPRDAYYDKVKAVAYKATAPLYERIAGGLFDKGVKQYKQVGHSRKKVSSVQTTWRPEETAWLDALSDEEKRLGLEAEFTIRPSIRVATLAWCRHVDIVVPIEIRCVKDLHMLADLVRGLLKGETTMQGEFPGYVYGKSQWVAEGLAVDSDE